MNKKIVKIILIVSGVLLLSGLGIYGCKYFKNKNSHKNTSESENQLKEVSNLKTAVSGYAGSYSFKAYYNGPILVGNECILTSHSCYKYNFYGTIYVNDSVKLKSSWVFYSYETEYTASSISMISSSNYLIDSRSYSGYILLSIGNVTSSSSKTLNGYPYTKIFNAYTGDLIFEVPTNSNEKITGYSSTYTNNMMLSTFSSGYIYYLKSNYNLSDGNNVEVHKVTFNPTSYSYTDDIASYAKATITTS